MTGSWVKQWPGKVFSYCDDGRLEIFETATHWVQHEEPAQINSLLSEFFA